LGEQLSNAFHFERSYCFHLQVQAGILILQHFWNCSPTDRALHPRKCGCGCAAAAPLSEAPISHSITTVEVYLVFRFENSLLHFGLSDSAVTV